MSSNIVQFNANAGECKDIVIDRDVTPCFKEYSMTACLNRMSCVILFIADRVAPAFQFCLGNSTLTQTIPIRYSFFCLSHIIVTPTVSQLSCFATRLLSLGRDDIFFLIIKTM